MKQMIKLIITRGDGSRSESTIKAPHATALMFDVADELLYTMSTDKRAPRSRKTKR